MFIQYEDEDCDDKSIEQFHKLSLTKEEAKAALKDTCVKIDDG